MRDRIDSALVEHTVLREVPQLGDLTGAADGLVDQFGTKTTRSRCRIESRLGLLPSSSCEGFSCYNDCRSCHEELCSPLCLVSQQRWLALFSKTKVLDLHYVPWDQNRRQWLVFDNTTLVCRAYPENASLISGAPTEHLVVFTTFFTPADEEH